ncbi:MAG: MATE family efflux transporter, partial [bacterium]|nr:MATE family efflux transporter [bacterium]
RLESLISKRNSGISRSFLRTLLGIGQYFIATSSWIGLIYIIAKFGSNVLAGYTIAIRVIMFTLLPAWGLSNAAATLMGQNLGAKKPERAERAVWLTGFINTAFLGVTAVFLIIFAEYILRFFIGDADVVASGTSCLRLIGFGYLFYAFGMVIVQAFNGAGDTATPTKINFFCFWMLEIPLAWVLALPLGMKETGVYIAILVAEAAMTVSGIVLFRRGNWKNKKV